MIVKLVIQSDEAAVDAPVLMLNTDGAVAHDYVRFLHDVTGLILRARGDLAAEAARSGRAISDDLADQGSLPRRDPR